MTKQQRIIDQQGNAVAVVDWSAFEATTRPPAAPRRKRLLGTGAVLLSSVAAVALVAFAYQGSVERHAAQAVGQMAGAEAAVPPFGPTPGVAGAQGAPQAPGGLGMTALPQGSTQAPTIGMPGAPQAPVGPAGLATAPQGNAQAPVVGVPGVAGTEGAPGTAEAAGAPQTAPSVPGAAAMAIAPPAGPGGAPAQAGVAGAPGAPQTAPSVPGAAAVAITPPTGPGGAPAQAGTVAPADQQTQAGIPKASPEAAGNAAPQGEAVTEAPGATPGQARQPIILTDVVRFTTVDLGDLRVVSGWRYASATDAAPTNSWCTVRLPLASGVLASTHIQLATQQGGAGAVTLPWSAGSMPGLTERDYRRAVASCTWFQPA